MPSFSQLVLLYIFVKFGAGCTSISPGFCALGENLVSHLTGLLAQL